MFEPMFGGKEQWYTVVGVVGDTPVERLDEKAYATVSFAAMDPVQETGNGLHNMRFVIRTTVPPMTLVRAVRSAAGEVNRNVALDHIRTMQMIVDDATARMAFTMM